MEWVPEAGNGAEGADDRAPSCPRCGARMVRRTARRGPRAGRSFWGCSRFPECRGTRNDPGVGEGKAGGRRPPLLGSFHWPVPAGMHPAGWWRLLPGAGCREIPGTPAREAVPWNHFFLAGPPGEGARHDARLETALHVARKILLRGQAPPLPRFVAEGLPAPRRRVCAPEPGPPAWRSADGSPAEEAFLAAWLPRHAPPYVLPYVVPQAPFPLLVDDSSSSAERVDFAILHPDPAAPRIVVEIDGQTHAEEPRSLADRERDAVLRGAGWKVFRVPARALLGGGADESLERLSRLLAEIPPPPADDRDATAAAQCALAFLQLVEEGILAMDAPSWRLGVAGGDGVRAGVEGAWRLLGATGRLYGLPDLPRLEVWSSGYPGGDGIVLRWEDEVPWWVETGDRVAGETTGKFYVVRPAWRPRVPPLPGAPREWISPDRNVDREILLTLLHAVFPDKEDFWEGQEDGLRRCLAGRDTLVLLPTGGGKSLIYQLAAHALPGLTLVVSPLVALMEDQVDNLRRAGVDRAGMVSSAMVSAGEKREITGQLAAGIYSIFYVSPERLQIEEFRRALRSVTVQVPVPLVVIDEAHCVSEWGHDFRPAYLGLARNARTYGRRATGEPPAIVGLTGTASRAVLRDLQVELKIEDLDAVVTPETFDRPELSFEVFEAKSEEKPGVLGGILRATPARLGIPAAEFLQPRGRETSCGIVFCPHVRGEFGVRQVAEALSRAFPQWRIGVYHGGGGEDTAEAAVEFKENRAPLLVATKAFGMGIDKPNIRFTIHYQLPPSLEAFYQEAGRAGRDRRRSLCAVIASVDNGRIAEEMLDPGLPVEELARRHGRLQRGQKDDVSRLVWFHLESFRGTTHDIENVRRRAREVGDLEQPGQATISWRTRQGGPREEDRALKELQQALHRLILLGCISDYTVDYAGKTITVRREGTDAAAILGALRRYVGAYSATRAAALVDPLEEMAAGRPVLEVLDLAVEALVRFIYETIEAGRRAAIRSVWQWSTLGRGKDPDGRLRRALLDYLQETEFSREVFAILREAEHDFERWTALVEQVASRRDLDLLRGALRRAEEDYPRHPAVLGVRCVVEAMAGEDREAVVYARACVAAAREQRHRGIAGGPEAWSRWVLHRLGVLAGDRGLAVVIPFLESGSAELQKWVAVKAAGRRTRLLAAVPLDWAQVERVRRVMECEEEEDDES